MNFGRVYAVFLRYLYVLRKGVHELGDLFYWPLIDILLWGLASSWIRTQSDIPNLPLLLMTGLVFWQVVWRGSVSISVSLLQEFWHRNLVNLFSTPLKFSEWIAGMILLCLFKLVFSIAFGAVLVYVLYSLNVFTVGWAFLPYAASLILFGWSLSFLSSSCIILWGHRVEMFAWMTAPLFAPFSAVFYPLSTLPKWAQVISLCLPTTYIFEGMREIIESQTFPAKTFWVSIALNIFYLILSIALFRKMFEKSRSKGLARME